MVARAKQNKMSDIMKAMADSVLTKPANLVSDEAAHVALLLASAAWNNVKRSGSRKMCCKPEIKKIAGKRDIRRELKADPDVLLSQLEEFAKVNYPDDHREIISCGTTTRGTIRVEWISQESPLDERPSGRKWFSLFSGRTLRAKGN
jgi:hypothetical protein